MTLKDPLNQSVQYLKSIGPKRAESFGKIGIHTIRDLLFYFPSRYLDRSTILNTAKVVQYVINGYEGEVTIIGEVVSSEMHYYNRKQVFKTKFKDASGSFECVWFHNAKYFNNLFKEGEYFAISAKPVLTKYGHLQFAHPDFDQLAEAESKDFLHTGKIIPFYKVAKQLKETNLGDFNLRRIIHNAVETFADEILESLPQFLISDNTLLNISKTIKAMHFPNSQDDLLLAKQRLKFEELFYFECLVALRKQYIKSQNKGYAFTVKAAPIKKFIDSLPYKLTGSQLKVLSEIRKDLESNKLMNRLIQGDVGSGKTIVALISMLIVVENGYQATLMAPTEILADQHHKNISKMVEQFGIKVGLLIGGQKKLERESILKSIAEGEIKIVIGTHALIEDHVKFNKLGLTVIDEQHRFGVIQRSSLVEKGITSDVLIMTATPIPRTLSMTVYGDLDVSTIDEMPKDRKPIKTIIRGDNKLPAVYEFIKTKFAEGYQTFLVYPLVEENEKLELKSAEKFFADLQNTFLKDLKLGLIHGRMNWRDKEQVMFDFASKKYDVLISTTVIEVGIDVPDANIIVINDAFRFGLSQLHQMRGRVGRSNKQAYCILITKDDLAVKSNKYNYNFEYLSAQQIEQHKTLIRMNAMVNHTSGFDLSEIDLKLRGPGNIFGTQQSGLPEFKFINITEDGKLIAEVKEIAFKIIATDNQLNSEKHFVIREHLRKYFSTHLHLSQVG